MSHLLIFDLDGTLIDSKLDLALSVNAALSHMGLPPIQNETVYSYVGNGAPVLMRLAMGKDVSEQDVQKAIEFFLAFYRDHMLANTRLYPGVQITLDRLHREDVKLAVLTNKPVRISQAILDGLGLGPHFFRVYGGNSFEQKKPHAVGVEALLTESGIPREHAIMVGDSYVDVRTARNANIKACGVTYGFQPESFADDPPDFLVDRMEELADLVLEGRKAERVQG